MSEVTLWDYEVEEAFRDPVKFIETFLKRPDGTPIELYDFQQKYVREMGNIYCTKARQVGMSYVSALKALWLASTKPGITIVLLSITFPQALQFLKHAKTAWTFFPDQIRIKSKLPGVRDMVIPKIKCDSTNDKMSFGNHSVIVSLPNNPDTTRGYTADYVFWDEAAKFDHEAEMRAALIPTLTRKGVISFISTHRGTQTQFYNEAMKAKRDSTKQPGEPLELPGYRYFEIPWTMCPDPGYIKGTKDIMRQYGEDSFFFKEEYCCIAVDESVAMFTHEMLADAQKMWVKFNCSYRMPDGKHKVWMGIDIGRTQDVTAVYAIEDLGEYAQVIWAEEWQGRPFEEQQALLQDLIGRIQPTMVHVDETGLGMQMAEKLVQIFGARVEPVHFDLPTKDKLMIDTYIQLKSRRVSMPNEDARYGELLYNQLRNVRREKSERSGQPKYVQTEVTMNDDHLWAFCLACAFLTNPNPQTLTYAIGTKENQLISDPGMGKLNVEHIPLRWQKTLQYVTGTQKEAREFLNEQRKKDREWMMSMPSWNPLPHLPCPKCNKVKDGKIDGKPTTLIKVRDPKNPDNTIEREPWLVLQEKKGSTGYYVCEKCHIDVIKVRP